MKQKERVRAAKGGPSFQGTLGAVPGGGGAAGPRHRVLSAATAFGKTVIGAYLIGQRRVNTLLLVHSSAFLEEWKDALERFLNIEEPLPEQPKKWGRKKRLERIGQIGAESLTLPSCSPCLRGRKRTPNPLRPSAARSAVW